MQTEAVEVNASKTWGVFSSHDKKTSLFIGTGPDNFMMPFGCFGVEMSLL
jgi:hypothetical protein